MGAAFPADCDVRTAPRYQSWRISCVPRKSRSRTGTLWTSMPVCTIPWAPSRWMCAPYLWARAVSSSTGFTMPSTFDMWAAETSFTVPSARNFSAVFRSHWPSSLTGKYLRRAPYVRTASATEPDWNDARLPRGVSRRRV